MQHDGFTNKYSFTFRQRTITLAPLTPKQVYEDQMRLQNLSGFAPGASFPFDPGGDLRTNPSKEGGNDENTKTQISSKAKFMTLMSLIIVVTLFCNLALVYFVKVNYLTCVSRKDLLGN